jgi:hypothetical protein
METNIEWDRSIPSLIQSSEIENTVHRDYYILHPQTFSWYLVVHTDTIPVYGQTLYERDSNVRWFLF